MKVLMITGDKNMLMLGTEAYNRAELQRAQVDELKIFFWGRGGSSVWKIFFAALKGHFDVITAQDPFWRGHIAAHLAYLTHARLQLQVHTDLNVYGSLKRRFALFHLRKADTIRVVSEKIKKELEKLTPRASIFVLPVYVDISKFQTIERKPHSQKTILWIGRFEEEKDPLLAIEVLKEVAQSEPAAKLVMLGKGSLSQQIAAKSAGLPVETLGWQDPSKYLDTADVVLCTSVHESWGASMVEALAAGVPVVAPDVGIAKEAGANVVERKDLTKEVIRVLQSGQKGELRLQLLNKESWAAAWKETLQ
jgi:glycosyltransferase involved in cell wall biosynthesis